MDGKRDFLPQVHLIGQAFYSRGLELGELVLITGGTQDLPPDGPVSKTRVGGQGSYVYNHRSQLRTGRGFEIYQDLPSVPPAADGSAVGETVVVGVVGPGSAGAESVATGADEVATEAAIEVSGEVSGTAVVGNVVTGGAVMGVLGSPLPPANQT